MRKLKFRAWENHWKKMFYLNQTEDGEFLTGHKDLHGVVFTDPIYTIMQFTGLLEKNGVEIYEGDIVDFGSGPDWPDGRGVFFWDNENAGFMHTWEEWFDEKPSGQFRPSKKLWLSKVPEIVFEVIGNIYENPELLEDSL